MFAIIIVLMYSCLCFCVPMHLALDLCSHSFPINSPAQCHAPLSQSPKFPRNPLLYQEAQRATVVHVVQTIMQPYLDESHLVDEQVHPCEYQA